MDENTVLEPVTGDVGDTGSVGTGTETPFADGTETGDTGAVDNGSAPVGGDTVVNVISNDNEVASRIVTVDPYVIADGDGSLLSIVNRVFGDYQPRTQTVTEVMTDGSVVTYTETIDGLAGLDWYWLGGVLVFSIVLVSFFKFLGGVFKGR